MNLWFWGDVMPSWRDMHTDMTMSGIGTLINRSMLSSYPKILVCGSGAGYGKLSDINLDHVRFAWVRGPRTAALLGLEAGTAITDGACLAPDLPRFADSAVTRQGTIFVPHRLTANLALDWANIEQRAGLKVVLPQNDAVSVIKRIRDAELVIAESMHGAILADAFRVPWVPVAISHHFNTFKWQDWAESMEVKLHLNEALRLPRNAYFLVRNKKQNFRNLLRGQKSGLGDDAPKAPFENPNYLDKGERESVKKLITRLAPVVERLLARDLRKLALQRPSLSRDEVLTVRKDRIRAAIATVEGF